MNLKLIALIISGLMVGGLLLQAARIRELNAKLSLCNSQRTEIATTNANLAKLVEEQNKAVNSFKERIITLDKFAEELKNTQEEAEQQAEALLQDAARVARSLTSEVDKCRNARDLLVQPSD